MSAALYYEGSFLIPWLNSTTYFEIRHARRGEKRLLWNSPIMPTGQLATRCLLLMIMSALFAFGAQTGSHSRPRWGEGDGSTRVIVMLALLCYACTEYQHQRMR